MLYQSFSFEPYLIFPQQWTHATLLLMLPEGVYTADHRIIIISALCSEEQTPYQSTGCQERQEQGRYAFVTKVVVARF